jgi:aldehyde:ferredoxin oxidoreductase
LEKIAETGHRVLEINLSNREVHSFNIQPQEQRNYLGGKGLGLKYLYERLQPRLDPFDPGNVLIFMNGVYMGTKATCSGRFAGLTKSPLTGIPVSCSCGGPFGTALMSAGYEGLIITGKAEQPVYLELDGEQVKFQDASELWGLDTYQAQQRLQLGKKDGELLIGPAGENLVWYANIISGRRFLGRGGMGAVMGSKYLKAVVVRGKPYQPSLHDPQRFQHVLREANRRVTSHYYTGYQFRNYGTSTNVRLSNKAGLLPVNNFRGGSSDQAELVSGETTKERFNTKPHTCQPCSILCGHQGDYPQGKLKAPEYESNMMLGPNIGNFDPVLTAQWNDLCARFGMDTISAGSTLAFIMEATQKGLIKSNLQFGSAEGIAEMLQDIAYRQGLGDELANGTRWLARKYGGLDFAIQVKGMEVAAYDPRGAWGQGLSYAVSNRGACHLTGGIFPLEAYYRLFNPTSTRAKAIMVPFLENITAAVASMQTCLFTAFGVILEAPLISWVPMSVMAFAAQYLPRIVTFAMSMCLGPYIQFYESITGEKLSSREFLRAGERIIALERWMNIREGLSREDDTLPGRFLNEGRPSDPKKLTVPLHKMLDDYYRERHYDQHGVPEQALLKELQIELR